MHTVVIAVGEGIGGRLYNLYTGSSYIDAQNALYAAGQSGLISEGIVLNNPQPVMRQFYTLKPDVTINGPRPRGRPRKVPLMSNPEFATADVGTG